MRTTLFTRRQLDRLHATFEPFNRAAEAAIATDGGTAPDLAPVAIAGPVVHRDELNLPRLETLLDATLASRIARRPPSRLLRAASTPEGYR